MATVEVTATFEQTFTARVTFICDQSEVDALIQELDEGGTLEGADPGWDWNPDENPTLDSVEITDLTD